MSKYLVALGASQEYRDLVEFSADFNSTHDKTIIRVSGKHAAPVVTRLAVGDWVMATDGEYRCLGKIQSIDGPWYVLDLDPSTWEAVPTADGQSGNGSGTPRLVTPSQPEWRPDAAALAH